MILYTSKSAFLEIPKGLGNFSTGGGSSADLGPLSGSVVELSAVTEDLASSIEDAAGDIQALSGSVGTLSENIDALGYQVEDLDNGLTEVSGETETLSGSVLTLSAATVSVENDLSALSALTSANTADLATLSGSVETLSAATANGLETALNAANTANTLASSAYTRADAAYALAESLTGSTSYYVINDIISSGASAVLGFYETLREKISGDTSDTLENSQIYLRTQIYGNTYGLTQASNVWIEKEEAFGTDNIYIVFEVISYATDFTKRLPDRYVFILKNDGSYEENPYTGAGIEDNPVGYFNIQADGSVPQYTSRFDFQDRPVIMIKAGEWNRGWVESLSFTDDYTVLHIKGKVQVDGVEYAGYWKYTQGQGEPWSTVSFTVV